MHILLVEDSAIEASLLIEALRDSPLPARMSVIGSGDQVLAYLRQQGEYRRVVRPNLILWSLPAFVLKVHNVLAEIETDPTLRMIPVFLLTSDRSGLVDQQQRGLTDIRVVPKPMGLPDYAALLNEVASWWRSTAPKEFQSPRL
jgi:two-component system, chemotaxis family, response regulator Rcp1